jgi:hypothetical protein
MIMVRQIIDRYNSSHRIPFGASNKPFSNYKSRIVLFIPGNPSLKFRNNRKRASDVKKTNAIGSPEA